MPFSVPTAMAVTGLISLIISGFLCALSRSRHGGQGSASYLLLAAAYGANGLRVAVQLLVALGLTWLNLAGDLLYILFVTCIWLGVRAYIRPRPFHVRLLILPALLGVWVVFARWAAVPFPWLAIPDHVAGAALFALAGRHLWELRQDRPAGDLRLLAILLWLQGLSTLTYPFNRMTAWAPYGFSTLAFLGTAIGLGLMIGALREEQELLSREMNIRRQVEDSLRASEEKFKTVANYSHDWEYWIAPTGGFIFNSPSCAQLTGYLAEEFMQNPRLLNAIIHPDDLGRFKEHIIFSKDPSRGGTCQSIDLRIRTRSGEERWVSHVCQEVFDGDGRSLGRRASNRDITDRKQAEAELLLMKEELEQRVLDRTAQLEAANKEMEAFSYSVSHDLRAPLRSIDGFSQILLEDCQDQLDEESRRHLSRIRLGAQRMGALIDDLLKLSRTSRAELALAACDLSGLCARIAQELTQSGPERNAAIIIQPDLRVQADRSLLQVVMDNLLGNAWKFTSRTAEARIEVGEAASSPPGTRTFFVQDNGAGFDMTYADKLFSAFQRLHSPADFEGTGIGLAMVQRIIHRHGGRAWAEAEPGRGARFSFTLPDRPVPPGPGGPGPQEPVVAPLELR